MGKWERFLKSFPAWLMEGRKCSLHPYFIEQRDRAKMQIFTSELSEYVQMRLPQSATCLLLFSNVWGTFNLNTPCTYSTTVCHAVIAFPCFCLSNTDTSYIHTFIHLQLEFCCF